MTTQKRHYLKAFWFSLLLLGACSNSSNLSDTSLYCTVTSATQVSGSAQASFTIYAGGGSGSYSLTSVSANGTNGSLLTSSSTFSSSTTPTIQFPSLSSTTLATASGLVYISDSSGEQASCSFSLGSTASSGTLACTATPSSSTPTVNQTMNYTFSVSGGTAPYTFSGFTPGNYGVTFSSLSQTATTTAAATAYYTSAGSSTASAQVTDGAGNTGTCTTTVTVQSSTTSSSGVLTCNASFNPNPAYRGQQVVANANITAYGSGSARVARLYATTGAGATGYFTGPTTAILTFANAGNWPVQFILEDTAGNSGSCTGYVQVY